MDQTVTKIILGRMDKMEEKIDLLLENHWKRLGAQLILTGILTIVFQIVVVFLERK